MSIEENIKVEPEAISAETVPAAQQASLDTSIDDRANCPSTGQQTSVQPIAGALGIVERLRGVSFDSEPDGKHDIGFITENVAEVFPEAIAYDESGKAAQAVDCSRLVALLIAAIKEQQVQIKNQEHSIKEQKGQVARLRAEVERLKTGIRAAAVR